MEMKITIATELKKNENYGVCARRMLLVAIVIGSRQSGHERQSFNDLPAAGSFVHCRSFRSHRPGRYSSQVRYAAEIGLQVQYRCA